MRRRHIGPRERLAIFHAAGGVCHICSQVIDPVRDAYDIEHVIPLAMGGDEESGSDNLQPAHAVCHATKTVEDFSRIAKAKRVEAKHVGARKPRSPLSHPTLKRKVDGTVVRRSE